MLGTTAFQDGPDCAGAVGRCWTALDLRV